MLMTTSSWLQLLPKLPQSWKETLVVKTVNGTELSVQAIIRVDESFLVVRGRVAGTTEQGQVYFVPIEKLETICIQKQPKDDEMKQTLVEIFGPVVIDVPKLPVNPEATTIFKLSPEAQERLKSLGNSNKSSGLPPADNS